MAGKISTCVFRGSRSLQNLVTISQRYCRPLLTLKAGCIGNNGKTGYSIQGLVSKAKDTVLSKWLIWLVCGEPLVSSGLVVTLCMVVCVCTFVYMNHA